MIESTKKEYEILTPINETEIKIIISVKEMAYRKLYQMAYRKLYQQ